MEVFLKVFLIFLFLGNHGQMPPRTPTPHQFGITQSELTVTNHRKGKECKIPVRSRVIYQGGGSTQHTARVQVYLSSLTALLCLDRDIYEIPRPKWEEAHDAYQAKMQR